jgi:Fur family ferric uptake transcriptional regulator
VELHEIARRRLPRLSLGTVYRNLELLARMGAVRKLEIGGCETRYDGDLDPHYHVRCVCCGRVDDMHGVPAVQREGVSANSNGYDVIGHHLDFVGICPACLGEAGARLEKAPGGVRSAKVGRRGTAEGLGGVRSPHRGTNTALAREREA